ncbi:MAG: hypothetical protein HRU19_02855 [Pseudobacteriovorax sp.]|nr:hypothetical protein [Pseudobacteriovorax sp.]
MSAIIFNNDSLAVLRALTSSSVHSVVTDPPAGISFLGKSWDSDKGGRDAWVAWLESIMTECWRVLKPGGHAIVWALPRTAHWTTTAVENSGFEIRDVITHIFTSGVPSAMNISSNIDKKLGHSPKVIGYRKNPSSRYYSSKPKGDPIPIYEPSSSEAKKWQGWNPKLKPASEHWIVARKPLSEKTLAENVLKHGTSCLNIESCRVEKKRTRQARDYEGKTRYPSNLLLSHHPRCNDKCDKNCSINILNTSAGIDSEEYFNTFIYSSKASPKERKEGVNDTSKNSPNRQTSTINGASS